MIQINIAMPDSCRECWFLNYDMYSGRTSCAIEDMTLAQYFKALDFEGRHEECPLIDVPEMNVGNITKEQPEIIRCKDCRFRINGNCYVSNFKAGLPCMIRWVKGNDYCSMGERKTDG